MTRRTHGMDFSAPDAPLLHPLDIKEARSYYLVATLLRAFVSPAVLTALMLCLWAVSNNPVTPVLGPVVAVTLIAYVERKFRTDAWAYVPRRRQDAGRDEPVALASLARGVEVALLAGAMVGFVSSLGVRAVPTQVGSIALGVVVGLALIVVGTWLWDRSAPRDHRFALSPIVVGDLSGALTLAILALGASAILGRTAIHLPEALGGFALIVSTTTLWLLLRLIPVHIRCLPPNIDMP